MIGWLYAAAFLAAFVLGVRASLRITRTYRQIRPKLVAPEELIAVAFVVVAWVVTVAAGWYGTLSLLRLTGTAIVPWSPMVSLAVAMTVLALPPFLDLVLERIAQTVAPRQVDDPEPRS